MSAELEPEMGDSVTGGSCRTLTGRGSTSQYLESSQIGKRRPLLASKR